jgi:hypothetical protein
MSIPRPLPERVVPARLPPPHLQEIGTARGAIKSGRQPANSQLQADAVFQNVGKTSLNKVLS